MKIRTGKVDTGKSPYLPPFQSSAAASMFGDQGGLLGNRHQSLLTDSLDMDVRTLMMAREREKRNIREEILEGAILRRRELEAEVISELLMETDDLKRCRIPASGEGLSMLDTQFLPPEVNWAPVLSKRERFGLGVDHGISSSVMSRPKEAAIDGKSSLVAAREILEAYPFQRQPGGATAFPSAAANASNEGANKGKVTKLAKPTTHMATSVAPPAKRRFETLITEGADNNYLSSENNANRNLKVEYKCRLCQVTATCERGLLNHLNGKKHKSKERALSKGGGSTSATSGDDAGQSQKKMSGNTSAQIFQTNEGKAKQKKKGLLEKLNGVTVEDSKMLNGNADDDDAEESEKEMPAEFRNYFKCWCVLCSIGTVNKSLMDAHCAGRTHRANLLKNGCGIVTIKTTRDNARFGGDGNKMSGETDGKVTDAAEQKK